jgi:hypothetical protein
MLGSVAREALGVMAGIWWDLGEDARRISTLRAARVGGADGSTARLSGAILFASVALTQ